jgi:hypothetical protein
MITILTLLLIPFLVALGFLFFGGKKFTLLDFAVQLGACILLTSICAGVIRYNNVSDTEQLNGKITAKHRDRVSCSHSYQCMCITSCDSKGSCSQSCSTCYEHSYDIEWVVDTSIGHSFDIDRVDRQGLHEPARWDQVTIGEPFTMNHRTVNYIKAAPNTLFQYQGLTEKYKTALPTYPDNVYDYYHLNRLVTVGGSIPDASMWNKTLEEMNADLGARKQVNMVVVIVTNLPEEYFYALEQSWYGGKKNDAVLVIDVDSSGKIQWTNVMAWTGNKIFLVDLRDKVNAIGNLNREAILGVFRDSVEGSYVRKHMKDFAYLESSITPSLTQYIVSIILGLILSIGLGIYFENNNPFNEREGYNGYRY